MAKRTLKSSSTNKKNASGSRAGSNSTKKKISSRAKAVYLLGSQRTPRQLHASIYMDGSS